MLDISANPQILLLLLFFLFYICSQLKKVFLFTLSTVFLDFNHTTQSSSANKVCSAVMLVDIQMFHYFERFGTSHSQILFVCDLVKSSIICTVIFVSCCFQKKKKKVSSSTVMCKVLHIVPSTPVHLSCITLLLMFARGKVSWRFLFTETESYSSGNTVVMPVVVLNSSLWCQSGM